VVVLLGGGLAFALTRGSDTDTASTTTTSTTAASTTSTTEDEDDTTTTTDDDDRTTTTRRSPPTSRLTTTTSTIDTPTTPPSLPTDPSGYRQIFVDELVKQGFPQVQAECIADGVDAEIGLDTLVAGGGAITPEQQSVIQSVTLDCI
jgi:hypothetical protein